MKKILEAFIIRKFNEGKITNVPPGITTAKGYIKFLELAGYKGSNKEVQMLKKELTKEVHKKVTPIVKAAIQKWEEEKKKEIVKKAIKVDGDFRLLMGRGLVRKQDIETPKVSDYDSEEDTLVKKTKVILASKMIQLKRLIKKHPFVAKHIYNQLDALNKFIKEGNYKQAIIFTNDLIARVEKTIADEEGKVAFLEVAKAEEQARANIIETMDKMAERLHLEESQLLGKDDGLASDHFREEEDEEEEQTKKDNYFEEEPRPKDAYREKLKWFKKIKQKNPTGVKLASKSCSTYRKAVEKIRECLEQKDYEGATKFLEVAGKRIIAYGSVKRSKSPRKFRQVGISKPLIDSEDRSILTTFPIEYESEQKKKEDKKREKEKAKQESKFNSLKEQFMILQKRRKVHSFNHF